MFFDIEKYDGINTPDKMVCMTAEESQIFREYLDKVGRKWCSGDSYLSFNYDHKINSTTALIYCFNDGTYFAQPRILFDDIYDGYLMFSDFVWGVDGSGVAIDIGMRVIAGEYFDRRCGTAVCADSEWVLVEFDDPFPGGHNGNFADGVSICRDGCGWWFHNRDDGSLTILSENDQEIGVANISMGFDELFQNL